MVDSQQHPPETHRASLSRTQGEHPEGSRMEVDFNGGEAPGCDRIVRIQTGARLHFGLLAEKNNAGRSFGGCGMMIGQPGCDLELLQTEDRSSEAGESGGLSITVPETLDSRDWCRERIRQVWERWLRPDTGGDVHGGGTNAGFREQGRAAVEVVVHAAVPPHRGLGAGTQLALAVASGLALLQGRPVPAAAELAAQTGRGLRSAVGLHGFLQGGFLVDGGKQPSAVAGSLATRVPFPADWRVVLLAPVHQEGLSGEREVRAFEQAVRIPTNVTNELCRTIVMELLPALSESDFHGFSRALYEYGCTVGECFRPAQGGRYATRELDALVGLLRKAGVAGTGQTSWGPSVFALCATAAEAEDLAQAARGGMIPGAGPLPCACTVEVSTPLNRGAMLTGRSAADLLPGS